MIKLNYKFTRNDKVGYIVQDLNFENVVDGKYFCIPSEGNLDKDPLYNDAEVELIGYLTDKEYYLVANRILDINLLSKIKDSIANKLVRLNEKKSRFEKFEKYQQALSKINQEMEEIQAKYSSLEKVLNGNKVNMNLVEQYKHLFGLNLDKIYMELVGINSDINNLEAELLDLKSKEIAYKKVKFSYDKGLIGIGIGMIISALLVTLIASLLNFHFMIIAVILVLSVLASFFIFVISRKKVTLNDLNDYHSKINNINEKIFSLKGKKKKLLDLVKLNSDTDFFLVKAKFSTIIKALKSLGYETSNNNPFETITYILNKIKTLDKEKKILELHIRSLDISENDSLTEIQKNISKLKSEMNLVDKILKLTNDQAHSNLVKIKQELIDVFLKYRKVEFAKLNQSLNLINMHITEYCEILGLKRFNVSLTLESSINSSLERLIFYLAFIKANLDLRGLTIVLISSMLKDDLQKANKLLEVVLSHEDTCRVIFIE